MSIVGRIGTAVVGGAPDVELRPAFAVTYLTSVALWAFWSFQGLWAIERLGASTGAVGVALAIEAVLSTAMGYAGGHLSDRVGRKPIILILVTVQASATGLIALVQPSEVVGLGLLVIAGTVGNPVYAILQVLVTDLVVAERHDAGFAAMRVAFNLGLGTGPPLAGVLLLGDNWRWLFGGIATLLGITLLLAARLLPTQALQASKGRPRETSAGMAMLADVPLLLFLGCAILAGVGFVATESVLPIASVSLYNLTPTQWGLLFSLNPISIVLFQLRLTARVKRVSVERKIVVAMLLMGLPLLLLPVHHSLPWLAAVILVFVVGEMLWIPTSQSVVAAMAPPDMRGAYMGALGSTWSIAFALGPLIALQLLAAYGDTAMWIFMSGCTLIAALAGVAATRLTSAQASEQAA
jgi:MFS family permease